jgi:hypothetical protein
MLAEDRGQPEKSSVRLAALEGGVTDFSVND